MKTSIVAFAALVFALTALANEPSPSFFIPSEDLPKTPLETSLPVLQADDEFARLDLRQATAINNAATQAALAPPVVTTYYMQTTLDSGATTYVPIVYTQTFAAVPDQWPSPGIGTIGLGTLTKTKAKRQEAEATVYMIPLEMVLQTRNVVAPLQRVQQIEVVQPVTYLRLTTIDEVEPSSETMDTPATTPPIYSIIQSASVNEGSWLNRTQTMLGTAPRSMRLPGTASSGFLGTGTAASRSGNATRSSGFLASTRSVLFLHDDVPTAGVNLTSADTMPRLPSNFTDFADRL